jgi:hypothetical protein
MFDGYHLELISQEEIIQILRDKMNDKENWSLLYEELFDNEFIASDE